MFTFKPGCKDPYEHTRALPIPGAIDDYNHFIGGVDIANQLRASFSMQQRGVKPWRPLFYWLLDSTIINAFCISKHLRKASLREAKDKVHSTHYAFRKSLVFDLLKDSLLMPPKRVYITKNSLLPPTRLTQPIGIHQPILGKSQTTNRGITTKVIAHPRNLPKTRNICSHCCINLCNKCFWVFHYYVE